MNKYTDLIVEIREKESEWKRIGNLDLLKEVDVDVLDIITGAKVEIFDIYDRSVIVDIPQGYQNDTIKVKNHGIEYREKKGDLILKIKYKIPIIKDKQLLKLIEAVKLSQLKLRQ